LIESRGYTAAFPLIEGRRSWTPPLAGWPDRRSRPPPPADADGRGGCRPVPL